MIAAHYLLITSKRCLLPLIWSNIYVYINIETPGIERQNKLNLWCLQEDEIFLTHLKYFLALLKYIILDLRCLQRGVLQEDVPQLQDLGAWVLLIGDADVDGGHRLLGFRKVDSDLGVGGCQSRAALQSQISPFFVGGGVSLTPGLHWRQSITFSLLY